MEYFKRFDVVMMFSLALGLVCLIGHVSSNMCTDVLKRQRIEEIAVKIPCIEKYTARCGWLSLDYCTFTRKIFCDKKLNDTITSYYIVTDCCKGFYKAKNGTCIKKQPGVVYSLIKPTPGPNDTATEIPNYIVPLRQQPVKKSDKTKISGGGYAGIACGFVFLVCIIAFTINGIRKKRRAFRKCQRDIPSHQVLYVSPSEQKDSVSVSSPGPDTAHISIQPKPETPVSGQTTPQHLSDTTQEVKPLFPGTTEKKIPTNLSDIEAEAGATPLLSDESNKETNAVLTDTEPGVSVLMYEGQNTDNIPESDV